MIRLYICFLLAQTCHAAVFRNDISLHRNVSEQNEVLNRTSGGSAIKALDYQNARCKLAKGAKLLWHPQQTWLHFFFPGSVIRDHNHYFQPHDFLIGRVSIVPCQVSGLSVTSFSEPMTSPSEQLPKATWLAATYQAGPFGFWAYDKDGNSICRFCFFQESWTVMEHACDLVISRYEGGGEFDCSYELDNHLVESNIVYDGHDIPAWWSSSYVWTRALLVLALLCCCWCSLFCLQLTLK
jgi:hypothetical protein|mmetsp:Transcript_40852/g.64808  ORF Transcript_40852/g.64808 Transcript_40852/m.64808 type:complete len:239 (+) Transcript_40852:47-763(+)